MSGTQRKSQPWRVVYGETRPAWEQIFDTKREADAFAKKHLSFGDVIFSVKRVKPGEGAQSIMGDIAAIEGRGP